MAETIILASGSRFRKELLLNAGVPFEAVPPETDERAVEAPLDGTRGDAGRCRPGACRSQGARRQRAQFPDALVIGADQTLSLGDEIFHKPRTWKRRGATLLALSGQTHHLNSAAVLVRGGETLWSHVEIARMTMRQLDPGVHRPPSRRASATRRWRASAPTRSKAAASSCSRRSRATTFTIVGLPLLPLLAALRRTAAPSMAEPIEAFVCGHPIAHSRSPMIHGHWLNELRHRRQLRRDRRRAGGISPAFLREQCPVRFRRRQCHDPAQGGSLRRRRPARRRGRS